ncbi:MAG: hypothetical protein J5693_06260 [Bacteroidales bacterium]|nr:hypothetical protein [Bacteroidales bacterium]
MKRLSIIILAALLPLACIREDRTKCPCYLHVDLGKVDRNYIGKVDLMLRETDPYGIPEWYPVESKYIGDTLVMPVNKSEFDFCAWGNLRRSVVEGGLITPSAESPDSLWSCYRPISTRCEDVYITVIPERQFIPVTILVRGMIEGISAVRPVLVDAKSVFSVASQSRQAPGAIYPKEVSSPATGGSYYHFQSLLMTQERATNLSLALSFVRDGRQVETSYPIGQMLLEQGEDISLSDRNPIIIDLVIGSASVFLTIRIEDWVTHAVIEITI